MFIKKIKKDSKVYYILTLLFQEKGKDTEFKSVFIPEKLADWLVKAGVTLKQKEDK